MPDPSERMADFIEAFGLPRPAPKQAAEAVKVLRSLLRAMEFVDLDRHEADVDGLREEDRS